VASGNDPKRAPVEVGAEKIEPDDPNRLSHLTQNRSIIVRRALLSTAIGGVIPIPVMDDYVAGRVRAGLLMKIAASRMVDLPSSAADLLADPREGTAVRNATITAATLVALKLAWKKFFAILAAGRGANEMATTFQLATIFDHYCAKVHVGGPIDRAQAADLRRTIHQTLDRTEKAALVSIFRDGGRVLARSALEAPRWMSTRLVALAQRWTSTGGNPEATFDAAVPDFADGEQAQWLDRATRAVEGRLSSLGNGYLSTLVGAFEERWKNRPTPAAAKGAAEKASSERADDGQVGEAQKPGGPGPTNGSGAPN
jgi:hypothetical protein